MKIYISALPLAIGVVLQFGVSSSMMKTTGNNQQETSNEVKHPPRPDFVYDKRTRRLVAITYNDKTYAIKDVLAEVPSDNYDIPELALLKREGYHRYTAARFGNEYANLRRGCCMWPLTEIIKVQQDDVVVSGGSKPLGMYSKGADGKLHFYLLHIPD